MPSVLRSVVALAFVSAIAVLSAPGCSQQGEGQRCDAAKNGDADCDDGLVCIEKKNLSNGLGDICCNPDPANDSKSRCARVTLGTGGSSSGGSGGSGGSSSTAGAAGEGGGGAPTETSGGTSGASGSPTTTDGGTPGAAGTPAATDGGASGAGTGGQGGAG